MTLKKTKYQLLVFDWDGTLVDSAARIVACMQHAAQALGLPIADEHLIRESIGLSLEVAINRLYPDISIDDARTLQHEFRRMSLGDDLQTVQLFRGVFEGLSDLSATGYYLAVATGKSRRGLDKDMAVTGVAEFFPVTRTADETFTKPHPLMLEEILTDYDLEGAQALMVGDTEYDLQMAANIGMDALAVSYGVHDAKRLLSHQPAGIIHQFAQLPKWLRNRQYE